MTASELPAIPVRDVREGGPLRHAIEARERGRALRDDCLAWLPPAVRHAMPTLDGITRRWLMRSQLALCGGDRRDRGRAGFLRHLVSQRLVPVGLHRACAR